MPASRALGREEEAKLCLEKPFIIHYSVKPWKCSETSLSDNWYKYKTMVDNL